MRARCCTGLRCYTVAAVLALCAINPVAAGACTAQDRSGCNSTDASDATALSILRSSLFTNPRVANVYGWEANVDPCGTANCSDACNWVGVVCSSFRVVQLVINPNLTAVIASGTLVAQKPATPQQIQLDGTLPGAAPAAGLNQLTRIHLTGQRLHGTLPPEWAVWRGLKELDLMNNNLMGTLPPQWSALTSLQKLELSNNRGLQGAVPQEWSGMLDLSVMHMTGTGLCHANSLSTNLAIATASLALPRCNSTAPVTGTVTAPQMAQNSVSVQMSTGVNIAVSVMVGICIILGVTAGVIRIRKQQRAQRAMAAAARAREEELTRLEATLQSDFRRRTQDAVPLPESKYCSTPRLVIGPDGTNILIARKLKEQTNTPTDSAEAAEVQAAAEAEALALSNDEGPSEHGGNAAANAVAATAEGQTPETTETAAPVLVIQGNGWMVTQTRHPPQRSTSGLRHSRSRRNRRSRLPLYTAYLDIDELPTTQVAGVVDMASRYDPNTVEAAQIQQGGEDAPPENQTMQGINDQDDGHAPSGGHMMEVTDGHMLDGTAAVSSANTGTDGMQRSGSSSSIQRGPGNVSGDNDPAKLEEAESVAAGRLTNVPSTQQSSGTLLSRPVSHVGSPTHNSAADMSGSGAPDDIELGLQSRGSAESGMAQRQGSGWLSLPSWLRR